MRFLQVLLILERPNSTGRNPVKALKLKGLKIVSPISFPLPSEISGCLPVLVKYALPQPAWGPYNFRQLEATVTHSSLFIYSINDDDFCQTGSYEYLPNTVLFEK